MRTVLPFLLTCFANASVTLADAAPVHYEGFSLHAKENSDIRMQSEEVNIYLGQRCRVDAKFEMQNETNRPIDLVVGFPYRHTSSTKQDIYDFQVRVNDESTPKQVRKPEPYPDSDVALRWFVWSQAFPPGRTVMRVEYHIDPSGSYQNSWQNVYYILETGRYWKGTIGQALVAIHFEEPLTWERIRADTTPGGFLIEGNRLVWRFADLEPTRWDDIHLEYMPSTIYQKLQHLRRNVERNANDEASVVELARHCFALGPYEGFLRELLPRMLTRDQFQAALSKTTEPDDKSLLARAYVPAPAEPNATQAGTDRASAPGLDKIVYVPGRAFPNRLDFHTYERMLNLLTSAGVMPYQSSEHVAKARDLLEALLEKNPRNADAWMMYLSHYYRFKPRARAPLYRLDARPVPADQKEAVKRAYSYCPSHEGIKAWYDLVTSEAADSAQSPSVPPFEFMKMAGRQHLDGSDPLAVLFNYCADARVYQVQWEQ